MSAKLRAQLTVRMFTDRKCFGPGVARLLRGVERRRSLRAAAQEMEMAYSKAWTVIRGAEEGLGVKLLHSSAGGRGGGGAKLTAEGEKLLAAYEDYCAKLEAYGEELFRESFAFCTDFEKEES